MARRRTLRKQYYKNRQKNYNISKIKRVKRRKTKTRKLRGGFPNIFGRAKIHPITKDDSSKQPTIEQVQEYMRQKQVNMKMINKTLEERITNITQSARELEKLHDTDEGMALFDKLLEAAKAHRPDIDSRYFDNYTRDYLTEVKPYIDTLSEDGMEYMRYIHTFAYKFRKNLYYDKNTSKNTSKVVFTQQEEELFSEINKHILNIINYSNIDDEYLFVSF